jgi:hypothetical protein
MGEFGPTMAYGRPRFGPILDHGQAWALMAHGGGKFGPIMGPAAAAAAAADAAAAAVISQKYKLMY